MASSTIGADLLASINRNDSFATDAIQILSRVANVEQVAFLIAEVGDWIYCGGDLSMESIDTDLLHAAIDSQGNQSNGRQFVYSGTQQGESIPVVVFSATESIPDNVGEEAIAAFQIWWERQCSEKRIQQLEAVVDIAARWLSYQDTGQLFQEIAEASTRLVGAERASLFLRDEARGELVARPALGIESGELRLPDDRGVVGSVIQTGESVVINHGETDDRIDHSVDEKLGFVTRSLLCCPMFDHDGKIIGAFELINKIDGHFILSDLSIARELALHASVALDETQQLESLVSARAVRTEQAADAVQLIGDCPAIEAIRNTIDRIANTDLHILILGENGTGKEVVSQLIHYRSERCHEPMVAVNCAALPDTLLESELFGHVRGAFTDAHDDRAGKFELASNGTLLLDEIGDMSLAGQAKLLRVLEEKQVVRVGGSESISTDSRVLAATNQQLTELVREKRFREDLYFRLNVVTIEVPPLRERGEDVVLLAEHFLETLSRKAGRAVPELSADAKSKLISHNWPGNVRELRNVMERVVYLTDQDRVDAKDLEFVLSPSESTPVMSLDYSLNEATKLFQHQYITKVVENCGGNMSRASKRLGVFRSNLYRKLKQLEEDEPT
ncbi:MAG: sigma-54-dependent Fis family transcriptional regulator [Pirellulales bacterium]|nr:sigma-54-dependent Fis family transcriptional regulator [Pirellulales bacterium]